MDIKGLSPLVRGNRRKRRARRLSGGSIPARAGKPHHAPGRQSRNRVYPRSCGETLITLIRRFDGVGLSPLVRGNRSLPVSDAAPPGSIPARAGKPSGCFEKQSLVWVYPRSCGETYVESADANGTMGLSPLVRGNHGQHRPSRFCTRSIPARAGKPLDSRHDLINQRVYPRSCGETKVHHPPRHDP